MKDAEIVELYWNRDESAITQSQITYGKYCMHIAFQILHNQEDSDECINDTWLRAWNSIPPNRPDKLGIYLGTITRNLSFDLWKRKNAAKRGNGELETQIDELLECVAGRDTVEEIVEAKQLGENINQFLRTLPEKDCNVFLRRYWYGEDYKEIADRYDMKLNSVKTSLFRSRTKLRAYLEQEGVMV